MKLNRLFWGAIFLGCAALLSSCNSGGTSSGLTSGNDLNGSDLVGGGISKPVTNPRIIPDPGSDTEQGSGGSDGGTGTGTGGSNEPATVKFLLTDAPNPAIDSAVVTLSGVSVHGTGGGWYSVMDEARTLDLLDLQNGVTTLLGEISLEAGKYTQIRMVVESGEVISEETAYVVDVPSGEIKINHNIDVCGGGEIEIVIDFDAEQSLSYNKGRNLFMMRPVVKVESIDATCPDEEPPAQDEDSGEEPVDDGEDYAYDGPLGWLSIVVPTVIVEDFASLTALVNDIQVHDQGIGQVTTFAEDYEVDLLEEARQATDPDTGEPLYTILVPPVQVPAGDLDQVRLLFESIVAVANETGSTVIIQLPEDCEEDGDCEEVDDEAKDEETGAEEDEGIVEEEAPIIQTEEEGSEDPLPEEEPDSDTSDVEEEDTGLKFFGPIEVCEDELTTLKWNIDLSIEDLPFTEGESATVVKLHPVIQNPEVLSVCEPYESSSDEDDQDTDEETGDDAEEVGDDDQAEDDPGAEEEETP